MGAADVINFMDGVNGITGAYALASLVPLALLNAGGGVFERGEVGKMVDEHKQN